MHCQPPPRIQKMVPDLPYSLQVGPWQPKYRLQSHAPSYRVP